MAFRKRKLINNWENRDLDLKLEDSDSRIVLDRGEDFGKLVSLGSVSASGVAGWSASDHVPAGHDAAHLRVDWAAVSETLECVPLHTRLGLDSSYFTKEAVSRFEEEALCQRTKLGLQEPEASTGEAAKTPCQKAPTDETAPHGSETSSTAETVEQLSLELDELLSSGPGATGDSEGNQKHASSVESERRSGKSGAGHDDGQGELSGRPGRRVEEARDTELDALLGLSRGEGSGGTDSSRPPAASGSGSSDTTGELEDWLEGVLD